MLFRPPLIGVASSAFSVASDEYTRRNVGRRIALRTVYCRETSARISVIEINAFLVPARPLMMLPTTKSNQAHEFSTRHHARQHRSQKPS